MENTVKCLNCGYEFELDMAEFDELGWHTTCPECKGSFDVDIDGDYLVNLWRFDSSAPYSSIDDVPKNHEFVEQFVFNKTETIEQCTVLLQKLEKFEGMTYELFEVETGEDVALGVFSKDSLYDDVWYSTEHNTIKTAYKHLTLTTENSRTITVYNTETGKSTEFVAVGNVNSEHDLLSELKNFASMAENVINIKSFDAYCAEWGYEGAEEILTAQDYYNDDCIALKKLCEVCTDKGEIANLANDLYFLLIKAEQQ